MTAVAKIRYLFGTADRFEVARNPVIASTLTNAEA